MFTRQSCRAFVLVAFVACAAPREPAHDASRASTTSAERLFPVPERGLEFELPPDEFVDGTELLQAFTRATGWTIVTSGVEGWPAWKAGVTVAAAESVPRERVYAFVEAILDEKGCVLSIANEREPRLLTLHSIDDARVPNALANARLVDAAEIGAWREHPAQLVRVLTTVASEEARIAVGALESTRIGGRFSRITVLGSSRVILIEGPAPWVAKQCDLVDGLERSLAHEPAAALR